MISIFASTKRAAMNTFVPIGTFSFSFIPLGYVGLVVVLLGQTNGMHSPLGLVPNCSPE